MTDPVSYRREAKLKAAPLIALVEREGYTAYSKVVHSYVEHGDETGVTLLPDAMDAIARDYPAYAATLPGFKTPRPPRQPENRRAAHALRVRLTDEQFAVVKELMARMDCSTNQEFLLRCICQMAYEKDMVIPDV